MGTEDPNVLATVEFEVFGQVQGKSVGHIHKEDAKEFMETPGDGSTLQNLQLDLRFIPTPQGCYLTKYCKEIAEQLGVGGWVKNSKKGTVVGKLQGNKAQLDQMIDWLSTTGSPGCKIEKCELTNWQFVARLDYNGFSIRF